MAMNPHFKPDLLVAPAQDDHSLGPEDAPVSVVEYGDFECPSCKQAAPAVKMLMRHFAGRIRFIFRHFPLEEIHPHALRAAEAAESAGHQDRFWSMHDILFDHQAQLDAEHLAGYAAELRLNMPRYTSDMSGRTCLACVREQVEGGQRSGVRATPTFFVDGMIQDVSFGLQSLFDGVEAALRRQGVMTDPTHASERRP